MGRFDFGERREGSLEESLQHVKELSSGRGETFNIAKPTRWNHWHSLPKDIVLLRLRNWSSNRLIRK